MTTIEVRYNYRLRVGTNQQAKLTEVFDACRYVWNRSLGDWSDAWKNEQRIVRYRDADKALTARRKQLDWLRAQPSVPEQQVVRDLYKSIGAFFDKKNPAGRPSFKKKGTHHSARWTKNGFVVRDGRLHVAVAGGRTALRVVWSRELPADPSSVTIYQDRCDRYFASFVCRIEVPQERLAPTCKATGLDVGLSRFATVEDEQHDVENPRYLRNAQQALARSQRNVSSKKKGSKNRGKVKRRLARQHAKVAAQRLDFQHKAARELVVNYDRIGVEDLRVKNMMVKSKREGHKRAKTGLNRSIGDASWSQFIHVLEHQAKKAGAEIVKVPAAYTSQRCSQCESIAKTRLELSDRMFRCSECGLEMDRDRNAARNLNPDRVRQNPAGLLSGRGVDGSKTRVPAGTLAA
jgi:putative transposase